MQLKETRKILNAFGKYVVQQSRTNLTKGSKNSTNELYQSLDYKFDIESDAFVISILMEDYGKFQDKGVRGAGRVRKTTSKFNSRNNKGKMWKQKGGNSPYSFREGIKPSVKHFEDWSRRKGLNAYAVRESVYRQGIKPSLFFTKPFEAAFKRLPEDIIQKFALDVEQGIILGIKK